MENNFKN